VHAGLASLIESQGAGLEGRRILLYSYGSGLAASLWSVVGRKVDGKFALGSIASKVSWMAADDLSSRSAPGSGRS
jgi:hydroxymethylglutaryl-CoA synthase